MGIQKLRVYVDSNLVANQINGEFEARGESMIRYLMKAREYAEAFRKFKIRHVPRALNHNADALRNLVATTFFELTKKALLEVLKERSTKLKEVNMVVKEEGDTWMTPIIKCIEKDESSSVIGSKSYDARILLANHAFECTLRDSKVRLMSNTLASAAASKGEHNINQGPMAFLPIGTGHSEIGMPAHRTMMISEAVNNFELRLNLDLLQERRDMEAIKEAKYKKKMEQQYNKRVRSVSFFPGKYMYRRNEANRAENHEKLAPT
uniref:Reverse transcriptase domain-containing protein n=1 Tax=Tanacetum cinerariifolium TaxID=118510 RepID=A0A6L2MHV8_TANCI|nr:reverse transcriptase domain-containing protein [Tanacetum cinerariifolium]